MREVQVDRLSRSISSTNRIEALALTQTLGGQWCGTYGLARCPAHSDRNPSLSIRDGEQELIVNCFAGCDWKDVKAALARQGLIERFVPASNSAARIILAPPREPHADQARRMESAVRIWAASVPLCGTLGQRYFVERRGLHVELLELDHALRWHQGVGAVIALMTDPHTNKPIGIHRTFLDADAAKRERKMLGRQGVVRLSPDEDVIEALGIAEGVEDALAVLLSGWAPVWTVTSASALGRFPVLSGIECLTIFSDTDAIGMRAAEDCAARWLSAGREVRTSPAKE